MELPPQAVHDEFVHRRGFTFQLFTRNFRQGGRGIELPPQKRLRASGRKKWCTFSVA